MGVRNTYTENRVALMDSVTGFAFGPTFTDEAEAESYVLWVVDATDRDPRELTDRELESLLVSWRDACERLDDLYDGQLRDNDEQEAS